MEITMAEVSRAVLQEGRGKNLVEWQKVRRRLGVPPNSEARHLFERLIRKGCLQVMQGETRRRNKRYVIVNEAALRQLMEGPTAKKVNPPISSDLEARLSRIEILLQVHLPIIDERTAYLTREWTQGQ